MIPIKMKQYTGAMAILTQIAVDARYKS